MNESDLKFKIGDKVQLNAGSPEMTITRPFMREGEFTGEMICVYFDLLQSEIVKIYHQDTLVKIE